jgi:hypothetical protein
MPDLRVHADFDHDGRISKTTTEQGLSRVLPGLIILPNIDADGKHLPLDFKKRTFTLDYLRSKSGIDKELEDFIVEINDHDAARLSFKLTGPAADRYAIFNKKFTKLPQNGTQFDFDIPAIGVHEFSIESFSLPGTPLVARNGDKVPLHMALKAQLFNAGGDELASEQIIVSTSPVIFIDNLQPAERLYMCDIPDEDERDRGNWPTVKEVKAIVKRIKDVNFLLIPTELNNLDAWIQDQFQDGYCQSASGTVRVIVHLPRLRSNVVQFGFQSNLATFVPEHFPSTDLGIFQDFYARQVGKCADQRGNTVKIDFEKSYELFLLFGRIYDVWSLIQSLHDSDTFKLPQNAFLKALLSVQKSFYEARRWLKPAVNSMKRLLQQRQRDLKPEEAGLKERLAGEEKNLTSKFKMVERTVKIGLEIENPGGRLTVITDTFGKIDFTAKQANELDDKFISLHSSVNYGGNLEVSGPIKGAPFGKIVFGANRRTAHKPADPDLLNFLERQQVQPLVEIDTSWLEVAHVDEVMTFLPAPKLAYQAFVIAIASPHLAMKILDTAWATYVKSGGRDRQIISISRDTTAEGEAPITRMLRGRDWLHHNPEGVFEELKPPFIYRRLATFASTVTIYEPEPGPYKLYDAAMTVPEFQFFGRDTNEWLGTNQEVILKKQLEREFPDLPAPISIPVLFDQQELWIEDPQTRELVPDFTNHQISAFLPNCVNMQIINNQLLIPKPYGPRTSPEVAALILKKVMPSEFHGNLNPSYFTRKKLDQVYHWIKSPVNGSLDKPELHRLTDQFKDGFPDLREEEIRIRIHKANRTEFQTQRNPKDDRLDLKPGWHRLFIPERTVDLFEAFTQIRLEALGLTVHFIDTWYYHIRLGEIHCGTNVLHRIPKSIPQWWKHFQFASD